MKPSNYNVVVDRSPFVYIFNGKTGSLLRMSEGDYSSLQSFVETGESDRPPALFEQLVRGGMLLADDVDEIDLLAGRYRRSRFDERSLGLTLVTSLGCNFDCPYCFEAKHPSVMRTEVQEAVLRLLDDQITRGVRSLSVTWFGGEPLVGRKPLRQLSDAFLTRCDAAGVTYEAGIITNGYLLDEETCIELKAARVGFAQVTIDGPARIHDRMRPLANGGGTFHQIVENLHHAVRHLAVSVRVNVDTGNADHVEELFQILAAEGLGGKLRITAGQLVGVNDGSGAPSETYKPRCFGSADFARYQLRFVELAARYGFASPGVPGPSGAPCTAVRANELVVGSKGELYKCWESVGNPKDVIGHISDYAKADSRTNRWMKYDPFENAECRSCIALPVCMGGCAHHALDHIRYENRCGTFRHTYKEEVLAYVAHADRDGAPDFVPSMPRQPALMSTR